MTEAATLAGTPAEAPEVSADGTALGFQILAVSAIEASPTNPRKTFDAKKLEELTESVKQHGVLEPVLVRPHPKKRGRYELIAGERRWRACKAAKVATIPAIVKDLDDLTTLEVQVVENLQREDIHPLEEAEGYEALKSKHGFTPEQLAAKVGKSKAYIYARLKLCALSPDAREVFMGGELDASTALLVARIPVPELQKKALKEIMSGGEWLEANKRGPMSYRRAAEHIQANYMLRLDQAPFDTKILYFAGSGAQPIAGSCEDCPKRTGNAPDLFGDVKSGDVCTDPQCFGAKRDAQGRKVAEEAKAKGLEVLTGKDAKKVLPHYYSHPAGFVRLDDSVPNDDKRRTWRKLLGRDAADKTVLCEHPSEPGTYVDLVREKDVTAILKAKGVEAPKTGRKAERYQPSPAEVRASREGEIQRATRHAVYLAHRDLVGTAGITNVELRAIVSSEWSEGFDDDVLLKLWGIEDPEAITQEQVDKVIAEATGPQLLQMTLDVLLSQRRFWHHDNDTLAAATARGIDVAAIEAKVREELKAKHQAEKAVAKAKGKKAA